MSAREENGDTYLTPMANNELIGNEQKWNRDDGQNSVSWDASQWSGSEVLVAKLQYVLDGHDKTPVQPAGDYLTPEDFDEVEIGNFRAEKILVKEGG